MRPSWFGIAVLLAVFIYLGWLLTRMLHLPSPPEPPPEAATADIRAVKSDLCRLSAAEHAFFETTGGFANESELRANGDDSLVTTGRGPYRYLITVPARDVFTIVAMHHGPLNHAPVALLTDNTGEVCTVTPNPRAKQDAPKEPGEGLKYGCEVCEEQR